MSVFSFKFGDSNIEWHYKRFSDVSDASIFAKWGDTSLNVFVNRKKGSPEAEFFPLSVEYMERLYASGIISSSSYQKREGFPSEDAILKGRIIDRAIRPRFPKDLLDEVQIFVQVLSYDEAHDPLILGFNTVVAALMCSSLEFNGSFSLVRVGLNDSNQLFLNNKSVQLWNEDGIYSDSSSKMNMVISVDRKGVLMFDADMKEVDEETCKKAVRYSVRESEVLFKAMEDFAREYGVTKTEGTRVIVPEELKQEIVTKFGDEFAKAFYSGSKSGLKLVREQIFEFYKDNEKVQSNVLLFLLEGWEKEFVQKLTFEENRRFDNRKFDEIRELTIEHGLFARTHGSGHFRRGGTQVLSLVTLASLQKNMKREEMTGTEEKHYFHEYYMPPYANGEVGKVRYLPGRREIGHGMLVEKALMPVLPDKKDFPYTIRVVSEVMASEGSTSMASTCTSTLALFDAGVPLKKSVAGITVGVIERGNFAEYRLLTDIAYFEDALGEMDFKITGTRDGITAIQMDQKFGYIPIDIIDKAFDMAKVGRMQILDAMESVIKGPKEMSQYAPRIETIKVDPDSIGRVIGTGGETIREITKLSGTEINIEDDGSISIASVTKEGFEKAKAMIAEVLSSNGGRGGSSVSRRVIPEHRKNNFKVGEVYEGEIIEIKSFGLIVEFTKGEERGTGLVHISEVADKFIKDIHALFRVGESVKVKLIEKDGDSMKLSIKKVN